MEVWNPSEFAQKLHQSWNSKRTARNKNRSNTKRLVWCVALAVMLIYLSYKFIYKH
jgi:hypothetical protein